MIPESPISRGKVGDIFASFSVSPNEVSIEAVLVLVVVINDLGTLRLGRKCLGSATIKALSYSNSLSANSELT